MGSYMKRVIPAVVLALVLAAGLIWSKRQAFLVHAAVRGDVAILNALIAVGADPNSTVTGSSPLYAAVWHHRLEAATALIDHGANVNAIGPSGVTPLITAAGNGDDALVRLLLSHGANPNIRASCGTPLEVAQANRHSSTVSILSGANPPAAP
jgi:ankyrin repeat protein